MISNFHLTSPSFNVKLVLRTGTCALLLWAVNPAHFDLIGHLNNSDIDKAVRLLIWSVSYVQQSREWFARVMRICRLVHVNSHTLKVIITPNRHVSMRTITSKCMLVCSFPYCSCASDYPYAIGCWPLSYSIIRNNMEMHMYMLRWSVLVMQVVYCRK